MTVTSNVSAESQESPNMEGFITQRKGSVPLSLVYYQELTVVEKIFLKKGSNIKAPYLFFMLMWVKAQARWRLYIYLFI